MLPPESTTTVEPVAAGATVPAIRAATPTAPAPSTTSFARSSSRTIASAIVLVADHAEVVEQARDERQRDLAGALDRDPVGDRRRAGRRRRAARIERRHERRAGARLHADDLDLRASRLQRPGDPAEQAAAADRDHHLGEVRHLLEQLEAQRRLPEDHVRVVEGVHERRAGLLRALARERDAVVHRLTAQVHGPAEALDGRDLGHRGLLGHVDLARQAARAGRVGQRLGVVAGAACHHAPARVVSQPGDLVQRAAQLERAGPLQVLRLQQQVAAARLAEAARAEHRRLSRHVGDRLARRLRAAGGEPLEHLQARAPRGPVILARAQS